VRGGSAERNCEPMDKNRIEGVAEQGERARFREALVIKAKRRKSGGCAVKECVLTWGDLASRLTRENLQRAFKRVKANKDAAGVDGARRGFGRARPCPVWPEHRGGR